MDDLNLQTLVLDALRDPVLVVDATGEVLLANPAALRVLETARAVGGPGGRSLLDGTAIMDLVRRAERVRVTGAPIPGDASQVIDVEALPDAGEDERRWMLRIRAADLLEREFWSDSAVATVAHEIRNPITAMLNALGALSASAADDAGRGAGFARGAFERSTRRLARLVDGLLDLSRVRTGALRLQRAPLIADEFARHVLDDFLELHPNARGRVSLVVDDPGLTIYADSDRAEQSLWNLLSNAVRFTPRTHSVRVRVGEAGVESVEDGLRLIPWRAIGEPRMVRIDVEDTGLGMTHETLEHVFDRHHAAGAGDEGAHLGLSITRSLIDAHDGWISVESRLGEGTTVSVFIPADAASAALLSGVRRAGREAARRRVVHRRTAVALVERGDGRSWSRLVSSWPHPVALQPLDPVSPRECAVWALSGDRALALLPLPASGNPSAIVGEPDQEVGEGAWRMHGFTLGWCGDQDVTFAQAVHRAAAGVDHVRAVAAHKQAAVEAAVNTLADPGQPA